MHPMSPLHSPTGPVPQLVVGVDSPITTTDLVDTAEIIQSTFLKGRSRSFVGSVVMNQGFNGEYVAGFPILAVDTAARRLLVSAKASARVLVKVSYGRRMKKCFIVYGGAICLPDDHRTVAESHVA